MPSLVSALRTKDFWITGWAIARYVPRSFRIKQVDGMLFFTEEKRGEYASRIASLAPTSAGRWGTMSVDQGLHHLNLACGHPRGYYNLPDESYFASRTLFRWILVDWFAEQPTGLRVPTDFRIPSEQHFDFYEERVKLQEIVAGAWHARASSDWGPHCTFGKMSVREWGKLLQIHLDYHLKQFGS